MSSKNRLCFLILGVVVAGCAASSSIDDKVIAVVGDKKITYGEFKQQYAANYLAGSDTTQSVESKDKFLNLLVDYNLKLLEAKEDHVQDDPEVKTELSEYGNQLAVSYILEHELTLPMVRQIYDRQKYEVRAWQFFVPFLPDSAHGGLDTLKAYDQSMEVIKLLKAGTPLDSMTKRYRGGDTHFITAGNFLQYVGGRGFENALYTLDSGQTVMTPIRTSYGYIIVKLIDRKPRVESVRASHILISIKGKTPEDTLKAYNDAVAILDSAKRGVDFGKLAEDNSTDKYSAVKGGDLGFFSRGMMVKPFEDAAFSLKIGEIAGPVRSQFGYHIIKLTDIKQIPPFDEAKEKIRQTYLNGGYKLDLAAFVDQLKTNYNYKSDTANLHLLYDKMDSTKGFASTDFDSLLTPAERQRALFTFDKSIATIDTVISIANSGSLENLPSVMTWKNLNLVVDEAAKNMLLTHYADLRASTYPEFDSLIKQYTNGILIYQVEQKNVWGKISSSDSVLKPYYFDHVSKYYWPDRVDISEIHLTSDSVAKAIHDSLVAGGNFDSLAAKYTVRTGMAEKDGHLGLLADSANALSIAASQMKEEEFSRPIKYENGYSIIRLNKIVPSAPKTFDEARAEVSSDYQEAESKAVQNAWLDGLKTRFGVQIDDKTFHEILAQK